MLNLNFWSPQTPPAAPALQLVQAPATAQVQEFSDPDVIAGPTSLDQFDQMLGGGELTRQQTNQEGWDNARGILSKMRDRLFDVHTLDNKPCDQNRESHKIAISGEDRMTVCTFPSGSEERYQTRYRERGVEVTEEFVTTKEHALYGVQRRWTDGHEIRTYHWLPNGTIREESFSTCNR